MCLCQQYKSSLPPIPPNTKKTAYGSVTMKMVGTVIGLLDQIAARQPLSSHFPLNMEQSGFVRFIPYFLVFIFRILLCLVVQCRFIFIIINFIYNYVFCFSTMVLSFIDTTSPRIMLLDDLPFLEYAIVAMCLLTR